MYENGQERKMQVLMLKIQVRQWESQEKYRKIQENAEKYREMQGNAGNLFLPGPTCSFLILPVLSCPFLFLPDFSQTVLFLNRFLYSGILFTCENNHKFTFWGFGLKIFNELGKAAGFIFFKFFTEFTRY